MKFLLLLGFFDSSFAISIRENVHIFILIVIFNELSEFYTFFYSFAQNVNSTDTNSYSICMLYVYRFLSELSKEKTVYHTFVLHFPFSHSIWLLQLLDNALYLSHAYINSQTLLVISQCSLSSINTVISPTKMNYKSMHCVTINAHYKVYWLLVLYSFICAPQQATAAKATWILPTK